MKATNNLIIGIFILSDILKWYREVHTWARIVSKININIKGKMDEKIDFTAFILKIKCIKIGITIKFKIDLIGLVIRRLVNIENREILHTYNSFCLLVALIFKTVVNNSILINASIKVKGILNI